ncbi:MAG: hypothetical protein IJM76_07980 [Lachnospiraceae bacterium]|nr:hypothetical protein [Lachnospiraceae bacterium]
MAVYLIDYENVGVGGLSGITELASRDRVILFYGNNTKTIPFDRMVEISRSSAQVEFIKTERVAKNYLDFQLTTYLGYLIGQGTEGPYVIISNDTGYDSVCDFWRGRNKEIRRQDALEAKTLKTEEKAAKPEERPAEKQEEKKASRPRRRKASKPAEKPAEKPEEKKEDQPEERPAVKEDPAPAVREAPAAVKEAPAVKETPAISPGSIAKHAGRRVPLSESDRKKVREALKGENLAAPNYTTIYRIMDASPDKQHFHGNLVKAFGQERGRSLYEILKKTYEDYSIRK